MTKSHEARLRATQGPRPRTQSAPPNWQQLNASSEPKKASRSFKAVPSVQRTDRTSQPRLQGRRLTIHGRLVTSALGTGYSDRALIELPTRLGLTGAAAGVTGGASIPAQLGAVAAGRGIDALTGRRSAVAKFVKDQQATGYWLTQQRRASEPQRHWRSSRKTSGKRKRKLTVKLPETTHEG